MYQLQAGCGIDLSNIPDEQLMQIANYYEECIAKVVIKETKCQGT